MHSDWFNGIEILQGRWQYGEKVGYSYPSGLAKTLYKWNIHTCPAGHERVNPVNLYTVCLSKRYSNIILPPAQISQVFSWF
jgi:hypothetical protein